MNIVSLLGSPSESSRSAALLNFALGRLLPQATRTTTIAVRELPAEALIHARIDDPSIAQALEQVAQADVILVATPIYKAAFSGLLKTFLDLLPQEGLRGKKILPLATGGSAAHLLALDYSLRPVLSALGARDILDGVFATDAQFSRQQDGGYALAEETQQRVRRALEEVPA